MPAQPGIFPLIWSNRVCRAAFISLFFFGIGVSCSNPFLTLFFVEDLGLSLTAASLFYVTAAAAPIAGFAMGQFSDRRQDRMDLVRICCVVQAAAWVAIAFAPSIIVPIAVNLVMLSIGTAASPLINAALRDEMLHHKLPRQNQIMTTVRLSYVFAWGIGPVLGSWVGDRFGLRALFIFAGAAFLISVVPLLRIHVPRYVTIAPLDAGAVVRNRTAMMPVIVLSLLATMAMAGTSMKFSFLPVYAERDLAIGAATLGLIIGIQPLVEVPLWPLSGYLADRIGAMPVLLGGLAFGLAHHLVYANSTSAFGLFLGQILGAAMHASLIGVGISVAQGMYPQGVGVASSLFYGSLGLSGSVAGLVAAVAVRPLGLPHVFYLPAVFCAIAIVGIVMLRQPIRQAEAAFHR
jgi:SET family sugar efflux transporter-like MFS transporter